MKRDIYIYIYLGTTLKENELEVAINADTKVSEQCNLAPSN